MRGRPLMQAMEEVWGEGEHVQCVHPVSLCVAGRENVRNPPLPVYQQHLVFTYDHMPRCSYYCEVLSIYNTRCCNSTLALNLL